MIRQIWKFRVPLSHEVGHPDFPEPMTPIGTRPVAVGLDMRGFLCVWVSVPDVNDARRYPQHFVGYGTGHDVPAGLEYVGTAFSPGAHFIWHVFERGRPNPHAGGDY